MKIKDKKRQVILNWLIVCVIIFIVAFVGKLLISEWELDLSGYIQTVVEGASIIVAIIVLYRELVSAQKQEEAEFIVSLNQSFVENPDCKKVFSYCIYERRLYQINNGEDETDEKSYARLKELVEGEENKPSQAEVSNYLTFFESLFILLDKRAISWEVVNELFKYRFFVVAHSRFIQDKRLVRLPLNFMNIYYLEYLWMKYNDFDTDRIAGCENALIKAIKRNKTKEYDYNKIIAVMEEKENMIEEMNKTHKYNIIPEYGNYKEF